MSMLLASAWLALRRIDETGDATVFATHPETRDVLRRGRSRARRTMEAE